MASSWNDQLVICPFYLGEDRGKRWIICEGHGYATRNISEYRTEDDRKKQLEVFCQNRYRYCEHFRSVWEEKYTD